MEFANLLNGAASVAVAGLWQGLAIVLTVALCMQCTHRMRASQRFSLLGAGFLAAAVLPFVPWFLSFMHTSSTDMGTGPIAPHPWLQLSTRWALVIAALWLIGSLARATDLIIHIRRLARLWHRAIPVDLPIRSSALRKFEICQTEEVERPSVIGFFRPRVLIPGWLLPKLTQAELNQIVLHESIHLARHDDWTNLFQKLSLVLLPLNPALWWMDRQLAKEREMACDEAVVRATGAPRAYAACLAGLAERGIMHRREALSLGAWQRRSELASRVHRILRAHRNLSPATARILLGAFGCGLVAVSLELAQCPQLVAFVPMATPSQNEARLSNGPAQLGDAVFPNNPRRDTLTAGAHVVQARAEMPAAPIAKPFARRARSRAAAVGELRASSSEPGALKHSRPATTAEQKNLDAQPQFIVFTTWERIETAPPASAPAVADYDTTSTAGTQSAESAKDDSKASASTMRQNPAQSQSQHRTTFTQLILRVAPSNSQFSSPAAIPIGGGWFVIQL